MSDLLRRSMVAALAFMSCGLAACGPTLVNFDPSNAAAIEVRPVSRLKQFCPGERFQVEIVARLRNGTSCSNTDRELGCQGEKDAVMSPGMVRIEASAGGRVGEPEKFLWGPPDDIFATADSGLTLRGWLEKGVEGRLQKSIVGESELTPVYQCRMAGEFGGDYTAGAGQSGLPGPDVNVAVTSLKTPYYPDAALIRVDAVGSRFYYISPAPGQPVRVVSRGQDGGAGEQGTAGVKGEDGRNGSGQCANGENGRDGGDGGPGGPGGDGGPGGVIRITVDKAIADRVSQYVIAASIGGAAGSGGAGGPGGAAGKGGTAGPTGQGCTGNAGSSGREGRSGTAGQSGRPGAMGPSPLVSSAPRTALFGEEMPIIGRIESAKSKKP